MIDLKLSDDIINTVNSIDEVIENFLEYFEANIHVDSI